MATYGKELAAFAAADDNFNHPLTFPTIADLSEWIRLRNYFYLATVFSGGEIETEDDSDAATDDVMAETMLSYFSEARSRCQEVLERVESYHSVFRMRGISATPATVLGDSLAVKLRMKMAASSESAATAESPLRTPPRGTKRASISSPDPASPSDVLTRTPTRPAERALFLAARPPMADLYRDPETEHVG